MINRRAFIESAVAVAVFGSAADSAVAGESAAPWTSSYFEQRLGQRFRLSGPIEGLARLQSVEQCKQCDKRIDSYHVRFTVESQQTPSEGLYQLARPIAGSLELFLQPRASDGQGPFIMEATVSRLIG